MAGVGRMTYLRQIATVEGVVTLGGRRAHDVAHAVVDGDGGGDERKERVAYIRREVAVHEVATELYLVDVL